MSREFGDYHAPGYFHTKLENAAEDADIGTWKLTRAMAPVLRALYDAARVCSSVEAHDASDGPDERGEWLEAMAKARDALDKATTFDVYMAEPMNLLRIKLPEAP